MVVSESACNYIWVKHTPALISQHSAAAENSEIIQSAAREIPRQQSTMQCRIM